MLTIPREMTEPCRDNEINLSSPGATEVLTSNVDCISSAVLSTESCLDPRRGGGDRDVSSGKMRFSSGGHGRRRTAFESHKVGVIGD